MELILYNLIVNVSVTFTLKYFSGNNNKCVIKEIKRFYSISLNFYYGKISF